MSANIAEATIDQPIPVGQPIPHRKVIRSWLTPLTERAVMRAIVLQIIDTVILTAAIVGTVYFESIIVKILLAVFSGFMIGRIFILGHDACHQSFTPHRGLNKVLGRLAFLPSLTPYSLWEVGHNVVHHGQTNLKGFDFVWAPLSLEEYNKLTPAKKALERHYRSGWGPALYYLIEIWWKKMFFPSKKAMPATRPAFLWDNILVSTFGIIWIGALVIAAIQTNQSILLTLITGFLIPYIFWNAMIGFVVYVHHTHPSVSWYSDKSEWLRAQPFVSTTVHLVFPFKWGAWMHHIMEHTAHHVDMSVPLYKLKEAQAKLENMLPERIIIQKFSWAWYFDTAKKCKLYDTEKKCWLDFDGNKTADSIKIVLS
jgi:acyl-lipid omega-6 desaturase (Delta-12 desaturase)